MPNLKVSQNTARKELLALKQLPTKDMTKTQYNIWERLVNPDANGNRLLDVYYDHIANYQRDYLRNVNRYDHFHKKVIPNLLKYGNNLALINKELEGHLAYGEAFRDYEANKKHGIRNLDDLEDFYHYIGAKYFHEHPDKKEMFFKLFPSMDAPKIVPPTLKAHVDEFLKNKAEGKINIINNAGQVKAAQTTANKEKLIAKKAKDNRPLTDNELEAVLYGNTINIDDKHTIKSTGLSLDKGGLFGILDNLMDNQDETNYKEIQNKRFSIMVDQIKDYPNRIKKQIVQGIINEEEGMEDFECVYNHEQLNQYVSSLNKNESYFKMSKTKTLTEAFLDLIGKRLDSDTLKEDDSPADFATGINNAVTSQSGVDTSSADTSSSSTTTDTSNSSSDSSSDFDYTPDTSGDSSPDFGGITGPTGAATTPDDDSEASMAIPQADYKVIDILVNDKDTSQVKVKIQNTETKEIETVDLSDIDV